MSPIDTLATLIMAMAVGVVSFFIGRFLGWILVGLFELLRVIWGTLGRVVKLIKLPLEWVSRKRKDLELRQLLRESEQANARRRLRRRTYDQLDYPRLRVHPIQDVTNTTTQ